MQLDFFVPKDQEIGLLFQVVKINPLNLILRI